VPCALALAGVAFFCLTAFASLSRPGLYYDEAIFINAALGAEYPDQSFVNSRFVGVPTTIMPYIGALKSWLYAPIFGAFGVSPTSIRIPALLIALTAILLAFLLARRLFGPWIAGLFAVVLATDPTYLTMTRVDWGPVALASLLRVGALAAYFALLRTQRVRFAWLLCGLLVLGLFNKLDYGFFIVGLASAAILVHRRQLAAIARGRLRSVAQPAIALVVLLGLLAVTIVLPARNVQVAQTPAPLGERLEYRWSLFEQTFEGSAPFHVVTGRQLDPVTPAPLVLAGLAGALLIAVLLTPVLRTRVQREQVRTAAFLLALTAGMIVCIVATREVSGPHHIIQLWPLPQLLAAAFVSLAAGARPRAARIIVTCVAVGVLAWLTVSQVWVSREFASTFKSDHGFAPTWTLEIYDLTSVVRRRADEVDEIITADWGIGTQVFALSEDRSVRERFRDSWGSFPANSATPVDQLATQHFRGRRVLVLFHRRRAEVMLGSSARLLEAIQTLGPKTEVEEAFNGQVLRAEVIDGRRATPP